MRNAWTRGGLGRTAAWALAVLALSGCGAVSPPDRPRQDPGDADPVDSGEGGGPFEVTNWGPDLNAPGQRPLRGFVDMHTHPMAHLGFGGHLLHGAPAPDVLMPTGTIWDTNACNLAPVRASSDAEALGDCRATHQGWDLNTNACGDEIRRRFLDIYQSSNKTHNPHGEPHPAGYGGYCQWPRHDDILHQQMYVDWLKRAHEGGLRVIVALAVHNETLARVLQTPPPHDDAAVAKLQTAEMVRLVEQPRYRSWMGIARTSGELRALVEADKLAVVLGVELDALGNMKREVPSVPKQDIIAAVDELYRSGVRYVFPVHVVDNAFGGAAAYEGVFNLANAAQFGAWYQLECANRPRPPSGARWFDDGAGVQVRFESSGPIVDVALQILGAPGSPQLPQGCPNGVGFVNRRGLSEAGRELLFQLMQRGMLIDIDHMSSRTVNDTFAFTESPAGKYPLTSGHNQLRGEKAGGEEERAPTENDRTLAQYAEISARGGIVGMGFGGLDVPHYLSRLGRILDATATTGPLAIAFGSDINGQVKLPGPVPDCQSCAGRPTRCVDDRSALCVSENKCVAYGRTFPPARSQGFSWNYNEDGMAHVGLYPDLIRHMQKLEGGTPGDFSAGGLAGQRVVAALLDGPEAFAIMWSKAEQIGSGLAQYQHCSSQVVSLTDPLHCGSCGNRVPSGGHCEGGQIQCDAGRVLCGSACVKEDAQHCGSSCLSCGAKQTCSNHACVGVPPPPPPPPRCVCADGTRLNSACASNKCKHACDQNLHGGRACDDAP